ncbi:MAG: hypothetical protein ABIS36_03720 [Chryseolinea sp.]
MNRFILLVFLSSSVSLQAQSQESLDSLKKDIISLQLDIEQVQMNLGMAEMKFKRSIVVATLGYSITIAGGLMLGRKQDDLGKVLLVAGGATGITGTFLMVNAFKFLGRASRRSKH